MADSSRLPGSHSWNGPIQFYQWFRQVDAAISRSAAVDLAAIDARVTALEAAESASVTISGPRSVQVTGGVGAFAVQLRGDLSNPGATTYYGTNATGHKGFYSHAVSTLADVDLTGLVADDVLRWNGTAWVRQPLSDFIATLLDDADQAAALGTLGAQPVDSTLTGLSGAAPALPALTEYADDAAAAAGLVPVGGLYRTGSIIKLRVA